MDAKVWVAVVTAVTSIAIFVGGQLFTGLKDKATRRSAAVGEARSAVRELIQAALDVKLALAIWETRWRDKRTIVSALARSVAQLLAGFEEGRVYRGVAEGLGSALAWRRTADVAEEAVLTGPASRMAAAAARIAMLSDVELREASTAVTDALGSLVAAYSEKPKSATRARADRDVDEAIGRLGDTARSYKGRPRSG